MTDRQIEKLLKAENILNELYWELKENHQEREAKRVDTINGKIYELMNLNRK